MPGGLSAENITAGYGRQAVLQDVSCAFAPGALACILGPNGAGKTTLLRVLAGLLAPHQGTVTCQAQPLRQLQPLQRARLIALVPQLLPDALPLTVREAVDIARYPQLRLQRQTETTESGVVRAALAAVELEHKAGALCAQLSGGERRLLLIAQGLVQRTPVLLLDEPTAHLDPPARHRVMLLLKSLAHEHQLCVVTVLHDHWLARRHCDSAVLLRAGRVHAQGVARECIAPASLSSLYDCPQDWLTPVEVV